MREKIQQALLQFGIYPIAALIFIKQQAEEYELCATILDELLKHCKRFGVQPPKMGMDSMDAFLNEYQCACERMRIPKDVATTNFLEHTSAVEKLIS